MEKPSLAFHRIVNMSVGFFGIQIAFALQNANVSRIFQSLGADTGNLAVYWLAAPLTGLLVQPIVGHFSDRTWVFGGRRRPYFLIGAVFTTAALMIMPHSPYLWFAAVMLWVLDASINISMEPFRAFVGDMLPPRQRTQGFAMQTVFIGFGAVLGSALPALLADNTALDETMIGALPANVVWAFAIGAVILLGSILWTVLSTKEYSPDQLAQFKEPPSLFRTEAEIDGLEPASAGRFLAAGISFAIAGALAVAAVRRFALDEQLYILAGGVLLLGLFFVLRALMKREATSFFAHILDDLTTMPRVMRRLAIVQFFSWFALFIMWVYTTPAVTGYHYGVAPGDTTSELYNQGANQVGVLFAIYNGVAAFYAFLLPVIASRLGKRGAHSLNLLIGAAALVSMMLIRDPALLWLPMIGIGIAWASILAMPYAILADALPPKKMGVYMGIFNFFIVLPQITVVGVMSTVLGGLFRGVGTDGGADITGAEIIWVYPMGAAAFALAAVLMVFVQARAANPQPTAAQ